MIEKRIFSQVEDLLPVISFGSKKDGDTEKKHGEFVERMVDARLYRTSGPAAGRMVHAREAGRLKRRSVVAMHIVDRRLNPNGKSLENRQRFLRRAKALVQGAVKKSSQDRDVKDVLEGGEVSIPLEGMASRASTARGGTRDWCCREIRSSSRATCCRGRTGAAAAGRRGPAKVSCEDAFRFVLTGDEFVDLFLDDLELPDLAKRKLAETETDGLRRAGYTTSGSPANISVSRTRAARGGAAHWLAAAAVRNDRKARSRNSRNATDARSRRRTLSPNSTR